MSPGMQMAKMRTTTIWADTITQKVCRDIRCRQTIWVAQNANTGNFQPFNAPPVPLEVRPELETGREKWTVDLAPIHFATCPAAESFRRRQR